MKHRSKAIARELISSEVKRIIFFGRTCTGKTTLLKKVFDCISQVDFKKNSRPVVYKNWKSDYKTKRTYLFTDQNFFLVFVSSIAPKNYSSFLENKAILEKVYQTLNIDASKRNYAGLKTHLKRHCKDDNSFINWIVNLLQEFKNRSDFFSSFDAKYKESISARSNWWIGLKPEILIIDDFHLLFPALRKRLTMFFEENPTIRVVCSADNKIDHFDSFGVNPIDEEELKQLSRLGFQIFHLEDENKNAIFSQVCPIDVAHVASSKNIISELFQTLDEELAWIVAKSKGLLENNKNFHIICFDQRTCLNVWFSFFFEHILIHLTNEYEFLFENYKKIFSKNEVKKFCKEILRIRNKSEIWKLLPFSLFTEKRDFDLVRSSLKNGCSICSGEVSANGQAVFQQLTSFIEDKKTSLNLQGKQWIVQYIYQNWKIKNGSHLEKFLFSITKLRPNLFNLILQYVATEREFKNEFTVVDESSVRTIHSARLKFKNEKPDNIFIANLYNVKEDKLYSFLYSSIGLSRKNVFINSYKCPISFIEQMLKRKVTFLAGN